MIRERRRMRMGLFSIIAACCAMHRCVRAFVPPGTSTRSGRDLLSMSADSPVSRGQLLKVIPEAIGAVALGVSVVKPATAALPTSEDYAFGTGSKTKRPQVQDELSAPLPKSSVNPNDPVEIVSAVSGELDRMQALVNKERWGDALTRVRSYPLTTLKSPTLGMGSVGDVARALGVTNSKASDILEASMEAGLTLREVEDVVFSNTRTLEFFNSADYKQVEDLAKNREPTDLTEPLKLLSDTKKLVAEVKDMMGAAGSDSVVVPR